MKRSSLMISLSVAALVGFSLLAHASGRQKTLSEQLVGTWTLTSLEDKYQDGHVGNAWGPNVKGSLSLDGKGHFIQTIIGDKLSSPPAVQMPPQARRAVVTFFGTYSVDEPTNTVTYTADSASEPLLEGAARKASVKLNGPDELMQVQAEIKVPEGIFQPHQVWKRAAQ